jgi:hypothetical protein
MFVRPQGSAFELGHLTINIIGPFKEDLENLRKDWNDWLRMNEQRVLELRRQAREDIDGVCAYLDSVKPFCRI